MSELEKVLHVICDTEDETDTAIKTIGNMRRVLLMKRETLEKTSIPPVLIDELMLLREWYTEWMRTGDATVKNVSDALTEDVWIAYVLSKSQEEKDREEEERVEQVQIKREAVLDTVKASVGEAKEGINVSYKVETKEIPKLPANKSLKGKLFDDWHASFYVKMCQAKLDDILKEGYVKPDSNDADYGEYKLKDDFLKNHLLTATLGSNAGAFVNVKTMSGLEMYKKLRDVFQGQEHEEDKAVNAASSFERLKFNQHSRYSPETFLAKVNECLKRMEVEDGNGGITKPFSDTLLPSVFRAKIEHPTFDTWKTISEKDKEDWDSVQVTFLRVAEKHFAVSHDTSTKFKTAKQTAEESEGIDEEQTDDEEVDEKGLTAKERKIFEKACDEGGGVSHQIYEKLSKKERSKLWHAKNEKKKKDGGLGAQYGVHQQLADLPPGTVLVPMSVQHNQVNNATLSPGRSTAGPGGSTPLDQSSPSSGHESNQVRAANFLQMANGNFVIRGGS